MPNIFDDNGCVPSSQILTAARAIISEKTVIQGNSVNTLAVGQNGETNPALQVDASTASSATGLKIKSAASGGGAALSVISSGSNKNLSIDGMGTGIVNVGGASTGLVFLGRGSACGIIESRTTSSMGVAQNSTPTIAQLLGGIIIQQSSTADGTVTTPTGAGISAGIPGVQLNDIFMCVFSNLGGGFNLTITAGDVNVVVKGNPTIPSGKTGLLVFSNYATNQWIVYCIVSA